MQDLVLVELRTHGQVDRLIRPQLAGADLLQGAATDFGELFQEQTLYPQPLADKDGAELQFVRDGTGAARVRGDERVHVEDRCRELVHGVSLLQPPAFFGGAWSAVPAVGPGAPPTLPRRLYYQQEDDDADEGADEHQHLAGGRLAVELYVATLGLLCEDGDHGEF